MQTSHVQVYVNREFQLETDIDTELWPASDFYLPEDWAGVEAIGAFRLENLTLHAQDTSNETETNNLKDAVTETFCIAGLFQDGGVAHLMCTDANEQTEGTFHAGTSFPDLYQILFALQYPKLDKASRDRGIEPGTCTWGMWVP